MAESEILIGAGAQEFWAGTRSDMAQSECGWNFISVARSEPFLPIYMKSVDVLDG